MHVSSPLYLFQDMCGVRKANVYSIPHITSVKEREHTYTTRMVERPDEHGIPVLTLPTDYKNRVCIPVHDYNVRLI